MVLKPPGWGPQFSETPMLANSVSVEPESNASPTGFPWLWSPGSCKPHSLSQQQDKAGKKQCLDSQVAIAFFSHSCDRFLGRKVHGKKSSQLALQEKKQNPAEAFFFPPAAAPTKRGPLRRANPRHPRGRSPRSRGRCRLGHHEAPTRTARAAQPCGGGSEKCVPKMAGPWVERTKPAVFDPSMPLQQNKTKTSQPAGVTQRAT